MNTIPTNGLSSNRVDRGVPPETGEDTLRLIAGLPAPAGLADRVKAGMRTTPETGRILMWRGSLRPANGWIHSSVARGAAAAAIVCLVAGGGWQVYSHVQPPPAAKVIAMPSAGNGFSNANAVRVPQSLDRPILKHPQKPEPEVNVEQMPAQPQAAPAPKKKLHRPHSAPTQ